MDELHLSPRALDDLQYWIKTNPKTADKLLKLFEEIIRTPFTGTGKPEPLKHDKSGYWSRHINGADRVVYSVLGDGDVYIVSCKTHYDDK